MKTWLYITLFWTVMFVFLLSLGCGVDGSDGWDGATGPQGATGPAGPKGDKGDPATQEVSTYTFGSNTTCQKIFTGHSAKKPSSNSSKLRLYQTENCSGSYKVQLDSKNNESYANLEFVADLEGDNSSGLVLFVTKR